MKMGFLSAGFFWGAVLVLMGLSVLLKAVFNIDLPVFRVLVGVLFILFGLRILTGGHDGNDCLRYVPPKGGVVAPDAKGFEYNVIFGKGVIDLTGVEVKDRTVELKANTIFGSSTVRLKAKTPALVKVNTAFGSAQVPGGNATALGSLLYKTPAYQEGKPCLALEVNAVFGSSDLVLEE